MKLIVVVFSLLILTALTPLQPRCLAQPSETLTDEGGIVLRGDEVFTISDAVYRQTGDIVVTGNATLRIVNTLLEIGDAGKYYKFEVSGDGRLEMRNSTTGLTITLLDRATADIASSSIFYSAYCTIHRTNHTYGGIYAHGSSKVTATGLKIGLLFMYDDASFSLTDSNVTTLSPSGAPSTLRGCDVEDLRLRVEDADLNVTTKLKGLQGHVVISEQVPALPYPVELVDTNLVSGLSLMATNCSVAVRDSVLNLLYATNCSRVAVDDSQLYYLYVWERNEETRVRNSTVDYLNYDDSFAGFEQRKGELTLTNSRLRRAELSFWRATSLKVEGCALDELDLGLPWSRLNRDSPVVIKDTTVGNFTVAMGEGFNLRYDLENVTVNEGIKWEIGAYSANSSATITGTITFTEKAGSQRIGRHDGYSVDTRTNGAEIYAGQEPARGVRVQLLKGNQTLWTGVTDADGKTRFNVTYVDILAPVRGEPYYVNKFNATESLTLRVTDGKNQADAQVAFFTSTPIKLVLPAPETSPIVWVVVIGVGLLLLIVFIKYLPRVR